MQQTGQEQAWPDTAPQEDPAASTAAAAAPRPAASLVQWIVLGLRAAMLRIPRGVAAVPTVWQMLVLLAGYAAVRLAADRLQVPGPADFDLRVWIGSWWSMAATVLVAWTLASGAAPAGAPSSGDRIARWLAILLPASVPLLAAYAALNALQANGLLPSLAWLQWGVFLGLAAWSTGLWFASARCFLSAGRALVLALAVLGIGTAGAYFVPEQPWSASVAQSEASAPRFIVSQEVFERQQVLLADKLQALAAPEPEQANVYGVVFAPYADEDVFLRETGMVAQLLAERFGAAGRVVHLVNHPGTAETHPWATPANMRRAIAAIAQRMDRERDVLVVYLTSHGGRDFRLAAEHWPLSVEQLTAPLLRQMLDEAGIRHRVVAVSACYSGGWIGPLASDDTLVMTAADATHTSYGCGRLSELTFFGRAVFGEELRRTRSFEKAFAAAVPVIRRREDEAGKKDGFSNPQISVGAGIRATLQALEQRLDAAGP
jgi:hypothetical protein